AGVGLTEARLLHRRRDEPLTASTVVIMAAYSLSRHLPHVLRYHFCSQPSRRSQRLFCVIKLNVRGAHVRAATSEVWLPRADPIRSASNVPPPACMNMHHTAR